MLDIFKKEIKKSNEESKHPIIIDHREHNSLVASELAALDVKYEFQHLPVGDYMVGDILIERKSLRDLQGSIINKRIFEQMQQMKAQKNQAILIIELNHTQDIYKGIIHPNALRGFFLSLTREDRIPCVFSQDEKDTAKYLCLLHQKVEKQHISLRPSRFLKSKEDIRQFILEGFPGIGPATAKKLLGKFRTIRNIINAPEEQLKEVLGKKYDKLREFLD